MNKRCPGVQGSSPESVSGTAQDAVIRQRVPLSYLEDGFGHWLAGFVDGEGCFLIQKNHGIYSPRFTLALREDDRAILDEIAQRVGFGRVGHYHAPSMKAVGKPGRVVWEVYRKADALALTRIFDACPLRAKKAADFAVWRRAVHALFAPSRDWNYLAALKEELESGRAFDGEIAPAPDPTPLPSLFDNEAAA